VLGINIDNNSYSYSCSILFCEAQHLFNTNTLLAKAEFRLIHSISLSWKMLQMLWPVDDINNCIQYQRKSQNTEPEEVTQFQCWLNYKKQITFKFHLWKLIGIWHLIMNNYHYEHQLLKKLWYVTFHAHTIVLFWFYCFQNFLLFEFPIFPMFRFCTRW